MRYFGKSDVGRRRASNQDSFAVKEYAAGAVLGVVCDGMGGAHGGETASSTALKIYTGAVDEFMESFAKGAKLPDDIKIAEMLHEAVCKANAEVFAASRDDDRLEGMGTTLVSSLVFPDRIFTVNVGDSRMYLVDDDKIVQVTHDHSYVQYLVDIGKMTSKEAEESANRNIITRAIGTDTEIEPDIYLTEIKNGGSDSTLHVLLCTDGLTNHVSKDEIRSIIDGAKGAPPEDEIVGKLIDTANGNGGSDNITAVIISV